MSNATLKVSFELGPKDIKYFRDRLREASSGGILAEHRVIRGAAKVIAEVSAAEPPAFVTERIAQLELLIEMLRDKEWRLEGKDRKRIVTALVYFVDPDDLIPDKIPGIGYIDDAIMVELVLRELVHEIKAYKDFCEFRKTRPRDAEEDKLEARRKSLQSRMRRRRIRGHGVRSSGSGRTPLSLRLW